MLHLCFAAGLRVSELVGLPLENLSLQRMPSIRVFGKGRKERCLPLWKETTADLRAWLAVRGVVPVPELFVNADGGCDDSGRFSSTSLTSMFAARRRLAPLWKDVPYRLTNSGTAAR